MSENPDPSRPDKELLELLEINLTRNDFLFNEKYYLQIKGTAMGKRFSPSYASIFMAQWEKEGLEKVEHKPMLYYRFLDDIWGIWTESKYKFNQFINILNSINSSISVTTEFNKEQVNFLDITIFKGTEFIKTGILDTKVYFKTTDTHALLHKTSYHPKHTFSGIVKSQLLRFWRICSKEEDFFEAVRTLYTALARRGYSRSFLRRAIKDFKRQTRTEDPLLPIIVINFPVLVE